MNKATLNRRNRERKAKRREREDLNTVGISPDVMPASKRPKSEERSNMTGSGRASDVDAFGRPKNEKSIPLVVAKPKEQKNYNLGDPGEGQEWIIDESKDQAILFDNNNYTTKAIVSLSEAKAGAKAGDNAPAVSSAVEEALSEEPVAEDVMEFMVDDPVDAPVEDLGVPSFDMIDPSNLAGSANIIQRGRMQEAADEFEEAGAPPRDPRIRSEMFMSAAPEEFEVAAYGPAMQEVAAQELMRELEVRKGLGQSDFTDLYDEIQRGLERVNPVGTTDGRPNKRTLERDLSVKVSGRRIPAVLANRILAEYRADYDRIRRGQALGYGHGGRRDRGVRR